MDNSSAWNQALRAACVSAFENSVSWFNANGFKFVWPRFLPSRPGTADFFSPLKTQLLEHMSRSLVMADLNGTLRRPYELSYVPRNYRDNSGRALTSMPSHDSTYLSSQYCGEDYKYLRRLGVNKMDHGLFLGHVLPITSLPGELASRTMTWHSRLAAVLADVYESSSSENFSFDQTDSDHDDSDNEHETSVPLRGGAKTKNPFLSARGMVEGLPVIPLRDGSWVSGRTPNVFFPGNADSWEMPGGLGFLVVGPNACQDSRRANLFRLLGVRDFNPTEVSRVIVDTHAALSFNPNTVTRADLVSQVKFLYTAGWRNTNEEASIWLATESDTRRRGEVLYIDDELEPLSATRILSDKRDEFEFIHPDYLDAFDRETPTYKIWLTWLRYHIRVSNIPRLALIYRRVDGVDVLEKAPELEYMIRAYGSINMLNLICVHWARYYRWIMCPFDRDVQEENLDDDRTAVDVSDEASHTEVWGQISHLKVPCMNGAERRLNTTFLPLTGVPPEVQESISFVAVEDPDHSKWLHLRHFGVGVKQDLDFYLRCLQNMGHGPGSFEKATFFYEQLQARSTEDKTKLK